MTVHIRKISRPSVIGGGIVPKLGGVIILVEIDEKMGVVNGVARFVNENKVLRRRRN